MVISYGVRILKAIKKYNNVKQQVKMQGLKNMCFRLQNVPVILIKRPPAGAVDWKLLLIL